MGKHGTLFFDGAALGRCAAAGACLRLNTGAADDAKVVWAAARYIPRRTTSAAAEYEAALLALRAAAHLVPRLELTSLMLAGDCRTVVQQMCGAANVRKLRPLADDAARLANALPLEVSYVHVPRAENADADALAQAAISATRGLFDAGCVTLARAGLGHEALELLHAATREGVSMPSSTYERMLPGLDPVGVIKLHAEARAASVPLDATALAAVLRAYDAQAGKDARAMRGREQAALRSSLRRAARQGDGARSRHMRAFPVASLSSSRLARSWIDQVAQHACRGVAICLVESGRVPGSEEAQSERAARAMRDEIGVVFERLTALHGVQIYPGSE